MQDIVAQSVAKSTEAAKELVLHCGPSFMSSVHKDVFAERIATAILAGRADMVSASTEAGILLRQEVINRHLRGL